MATDWYMLIRFIFSTSLSTFFGSPGLPAALSLLLPGFSAPRSLFLFLFSVLTIGADTCLAEYGPTVDFLAPRYTALASTLPCLFSAARTANFITEGILDDFLGNFAHLFSFAWPSWFVDNSIFPPAVGDFFTALFPPCEENDSRSVGVLEWLFFIFPAASFPGWLESQLILFETAFTFFSLAVVPKSALV
jgi:hypothetical protein